MALEKYPEQPINRLRIYCEIFSLPEEIKTAVRNHGGGHSCLFWTILGLGKENNLPEGK